MKPQIIPNLTLKELTTQLRLEYKRPKLGCTRRTFIARKEGVVYKLPIMPQWHSKFNEQEYQNYIKFKNGQINSFRDYIVPIALTERFYTFDNVPILIMELVKQYKSINWLDYPEWVLSGNIDSYQVGYNKAGQLVAYDHTYPY